MATPTSSPVAPPAPKSTVARLQIGDQSYTLPTVVGTERERAIDVSNLLKEAGYLALDEGFRNTASAQSAISFIDGDNGILRYRGFPIEQLAENATFVETALLLMYGELPTADHLARFRKLLTEHEMLHEGMRHSFAGYP